MALEMSDNGSVRHPEMCFQRLNRTKWLQLNMMLGVASGVGSAQLQAIVSNSLSGELLSNLEPIDGAPK